MKAVVDKWQVFKKEKKSCLLEMVVDQAERSTMLVHKVTNIAIILWLLYQLLSLVRNLLTIVKTTSKKHSKSSLQLNLPTPPTKKKKKNPK